MKLIVNIPAYNEEKKIGETIGRIPRTFAGIREVLIQVVDDGSTDQTAQVARAAGADFVLSHTINRKLGVMFATASENALSQGADIMVNIDADGQFDPADIQKLIDPILKRQADMVVGNRFAEHKAENIPWAKDFLNRLGARMVGGFLNVKTEDLTCGFRAHNRETLLRLNTPTGFTYTQETIIDAIGKNLRLVWIPVKVTYFSDRQSKIVKSVYSFVNNSARIILKAVRDVRPMKFFGVPGLILIFISFLIFSIFLFFYFQDFKISPYRNYIFLSAITFLVGLQFTVFALMADMIRTNRRLTEDQTYAYRKEKYSKK